MSRCLGIKSTNSKHNLENIKVHNIRNNRNEIVHGVPSIRGTSSDSYNHMYNEPNRPTWWG